MSSLAVNSPRSAELSCVDAVIALGETIVANEAKAVGDAGEFVKATALHMLARATRAMAAMRLLYASGFAMDARSVARTVTELAIDVTYMLLNELQREKRVRLFLDYEAVKRWQLIKAWERVLQRAYREPARAAALRAHDAVIDNYPDTRYWSGRSLAKRAKDADLGMYYDLAYAEGCAASHSCPQTLHDSDEPDPFHLVIAANTFLVLVEAIAVAFDLDAYDGERVRLVDAVGSATQPGSLADDVPETEQRERKVEPRSEESQ